MCFIYELPQRSESNITQNMVIILKGTWFLKGQLQFNLLGLNSYHDLLIIVYLQSDFAWVWAHTHMYGLKYRRVLENRCRSKVVSVVCLYKHLAVQGLQ